MVGAGPTARFSLVDHNGRRVTQADYAGRYLLVYFGFTHCRVVCPRTLTKLSAVLDQLGPAGEVITALYVTVDPARDTPEVMKKHLESFPRFTGLSGSEEEITAAKAAFRVFAERKADPEDPGGYAVPHTAIAYLMGPDGGYRDHFTDALDEASVASRIIAAISNEEQSCHG